MPRPPSPSWTAPIGAAGGRRVRYELIGCALHGHALPLYPSSTSSTPEPADPALRRDMAGLAWHRCLRCDAWIPAGGDTHSAEDPGGRTAPGAVAGTTAARGRAALTPPLRGRLLRDRYVLRLIALDRAVHVVVLAALAAAILIFAQHRTGVQARITRVIADLQGSFGGPVRDSGHGITHDVDRLFSLGTGSLYAASAVVIAYGALEALEMVGLWLARRWAEYLTFVATLGLLPLEVYELAGSVSALKILTLAINLAIAAYLLVAKRLLGVRGGGRREAQERRDDSGWRPIDNATPPVPGAAAGRRPGGDSSALA